MALFAFQPHRCGPPLNRKLLGTEKLHSPHYLWTSTLACTGAHAKGYS